MQRNRGLTFNELLVIVAILITLSAIIYPMLNPARGKARDTIRLADMKQIEQVLDLFFIENGQYPGTPEGISGSGEQIGDDNGPIEQVLLEYLAEVPRDPLHDGTTYYYSYDPQHLIETDPGDCDFGDPVAAVLAFHTAEVMTNLRKDTSCGGDQNQHNADFNMAFYPAAP